MGGACSVERRGPLTIVRINAITQDDHAAWLAAIVVWRGTMPSPERGWRAKWRAFRYRRGFDPLHAPFSIGRDGLLWFGTAGPHGERGDIGHTTRRRTSMTIDGSISHWGAYVIGAYLLGATVYCIRKFGTFPKHEHLQDPQDTLWITPWNVNSRKKWKPEYFATGRQVRRFQIRLIVGFVFLWLVLDILT